MHKHTKNGAALALTGLFCLLPACDDASDADPGMLRVTMYGEEFIEDRVPADEMIDGWEVVFSKFLVAAHDIEADGNALPGTYVLDLRPNSGGEGHDVGMMEIPAGAVGAMVSRRGQPRTARRATPRTRTSPRWSRPGPRSERSAPPPRVT